jgi:dCMP deaminase
VIIQAGIREVVYLSDKYAGTDSVRASRRMFDQAGVTCRQLMPASPVVSIQFTEKE